MLTHVDILQMCSRFLKVLKLLKLRNPHIFYPNFYYLLGKSFQISNILAKTEKH